jgi:hypothetical protein
MFGEYLKRAVIGLVLICVAVYFFSHPKESAQGVVKVAHGVGHGINSVITFAETVGKGL